MKPEALAYVLERIDRLERIVLAICQKRDDGARLLGDLEGQMYAELRCYDPGTYAGQLNRAKKLLAGIDSPATPEGGA